MSSTHTQGRLDLGRWLVACWNAFDGIPTEKVEENAPLILHTGLFEADQIADDKRMQTLVDALAKAEAYLIERLASNPGSTGATVILPMIRKALEGAGVTPTPTSWGDFPGSEATHG